VSGFYTNLVEIDIACDWRWV